MSSKQKSSFRGEALQIYILSFLAYSVSYIGRKGYSSCMSEICTSLEMTKALAGTISTGYMACYGAGQFFSGLAADKLSPRYMIFAALTGSGICNLIMGFGTSPAMMMVFWCLNGFFNSMMWASVVKTIAVWLPDEHHAIAGTNIAATIPVGTIASYLVSSFCLKFFSWRMTFYVCGLLVITYGICWLLITGRKSEYIHSMETQKLRQAQRLKQQNEAKLPQTADADQPKAASISLITCIFTTGIVFTVIGILFNGIIQNSVSEWVPTYITEYFSVSPSMASAAASVLPIVNLTGAYIARFIDDRFTHNEMTCSFMLFIICFIALGLLALIGKYNLVAAVLLIAISTATMLGVNNMFLTMMPLHFASIGKSSSITGILNTFSYLAAAVSSALIGYVAENKGWDTTMLLWVLVAAFGAITCLVGAPVWKKGRLKIREQ